MDNDARLRLAELKAMHDDGLLSDHAWDQQALRVLNGPPQPDEAPPLAQAQGGDGGELLPGGDGRPPQTQAAARVQLAAAYRMAARMGVNEADQNHFTLMSPTIPGTFLSIGRGSLWNRVRAGELLEVSVDDDDWEPEQQQTGDSYGSKAVGGYLLDLESSAWVIHAPLHRARPDAVAVLHTHMPYTTALASLEDPTLQMCNLNCFRFYDRIAYQRDYLGGLSVEMTMIFYWNFGFCTNDDLYI